MTEQELRQTGKDGVYRADLDQWFVVGEEPPRKAPLLKPQSVAAEPAPLKNEPAELKPVEDKPKTGKK